ncbi:hypothetical protein ACKC5O_08225 [Aeromonas schubertii]|uniref:Uncharacterized protein n=1 Tax=Aeromonas schubertii TaxID=652 RepID=A0A0S2SGK8_9GAMM|nr:hypothetical protein [Aeromonas schubertii]ALP40830.1 hypothetical protein WL1483_1411 [Aeromonas schubertii]KUE78380.1 hypothetical protein ATO46_10320 [Aeromonas schubertii]MBZ6066474.1 hypothetical protein [Aeromonas schubertii]MBZ6072955.1 hypothetical protein [Aeromonas schubertii]QCG47117.1 hypothetical protein E2P79_03940 [Aeromonas schubertii]
MTHNNEQQQTRRLNLIRDGERRMLAQLHGLLRSTVDELNAELEKEELEPVTVEQLHRVIQQHLFERLHKGDQLAARALLQQALADVEARLAEPEMEDDPA